MPGNPLNDASWSDFPAIAITDDELLITVNLLNNDTINTNDSWKFLFKQSIIWQINKQSGYSGQSLQMCFYNDILYNGRPIRNFCPIQGGSTTYGPDIYLLSNRSFDFQNDTSFILRLTGLLDETQTYLQIEIRKADVPYGLPPDGKQILNRVLQTNDARVLSGYIEDDLIHFAQNSIHPDTARAAVYHGMIANVSSAKNIYGKIIGDASLDFGYPNISYTGKYPGDDEAIITFNHTSVDTFPGFSAIFYNVWQGYSERVTLKAGTAQVYSPRFGNRQRWGDYSGSQLKYNEPGKVWTAGFYGERSGTSYGHSTWIAALLSPDTTTQPPASVAHVKKHSHKIYPNPVSDIFTMEFELPADKFLDISLYDASGKLVKIFHRDRAKSGRNSFSFSLNPLGAGIYFLRITDGKELIADEKIVKQESGR